MNWQELERLVRKYYGYVGDLEGSGVEVFDFSSCVTKSRGSWTRLDREEQIPTSVFEQIYELDRVLWQRARSSAWSLGIGNYHMPATAAQPRSNWWWYLMS